MKISLKILRRVYGKFFGLKIRTFFNKTPPQFKGQKSSDIIFRLLSNQMPCMISRMGNTEFSCVYKYKLKQGRNWYKYLAYIIGKINEFDYSIQERFKIEHNAGFFQPTSENLDKFSRLMLKDLKNIDVLASIIDLENEFKLELQDATTIFFEDLNPYYHKDPWSKVLEGKNVLVIHPFSKSIESQYLKRANLFENKLVLPNFNLITYKPVQSIAGSFESLSYNDWFEALTKMEKDISNLNFDIAIIGCGAYGLPLASYIKNIGKKAVHIGGSLQILFGIIGRRWETEYDLGHLINEHWVRPSKDEIPKNFKDVENGCYW